MQKVKISPLSKSANQITRYCFKLTTIYINQGIFGGQNWKDMTLLDVSHLSIQE